MLPVPLGSWHARCPAPCGRPRPFSSSPPALFPTVSPNPGGEAWPPPLGVFAPPAVGETPPRAAGARPPSTRAAAAGARLQQGGAPPLAGARPPASSMLQRRAREHRAPQGQDERARTKTCGRRTGSSEGTPYGAAHRWWTMSLAGIGRCGRRPRASGGLPSDARQSSCGRPPRAQRRAARPRRRPSRPRWHARSPYGAAHRWWTMSLAGIGRCGRRPRASGGLPSDARQSSCGRPPNAGQGGSSREPRFEALPLPA
mmetsp:Transcript_4573/g.11539  ORF Transcript_4573/g.11539 Transcript_4573/m.11539 type:complete len:257 (-) Transcript_4573:2548-3318(-)